MKNHTKKNKELLIYSFYRFVSVNNKNRIKENLDSFLKNKIIKGTILVANEGINGSISGLQSELIKTIAYIRKILKIKNLNIKINEVDFIPFNKLKVRLKKEIVSLGMENINISKTKNSYIEPSQWNNLLTNENIKIIDTRNKYEISIGKFENCIDPNTKSFREFPQKFRKLKISKEDKIALYCTGGIRCEKATAFLKSEGFKNVYQLKGGILNYLDFAKIKGTQNKWSGECFVFDNRVTVDNDLFKGNYLQCYGCRRPLSKNDIKSKKYIKGVACQYCYNNRSSTQKLSSLMRQNQIDTAERNNKTHPFKKNYSQ